MHSKVSVSDTNIQNTLYTYENVRKVVRVGGFNLISFIYPLKSGNISLQFRTLKCSVHAEVIAFRE